MNKVGRPKGGKSKRWTPEEKERIVKRYFEGEISRTQLAKEEKVTDSMLHVNVNLKMLKSSNMKMHNYLIVI
ncbi:transposase, partial [Clostridium sartagoforme]|uniref:transposase n=1 Tax=Clostridium sartagoforme TaxID=84031 RepID=UPI0031DB0425